MQAVAMSAEAVFEQLALNETWPHEALSAADARRAELVPLFLHEIFSHIALSPEDRVFVPTPLFFAFHLLGEWRETTAYRPLVSLLRLPTDEVGEIFGDAITETVARVMASVFDGDPQPLFDTIHDADANEYVRWQMFKALTILTLHRKLDEARYVDFLRACFTALPQAQHAAWLGWMQAVAVLGLIEFKPLVQRAFTSGFVSTYFQSYADFEAQMHETVIQPSEQDTEYGLFGDTAAELTSWAAVSDTLAASDDWVPAGPGGRASVDDLDIDGLYDEAWHRVNSARALQAAKPEVNVMRDIGRNDLCPCNSGKKYKKCCLN